MTLGKLLTAAWLLAPLALAACTDDGPASFGDDLTDPQLPARGSDDVEAWLAAGHYQSWHCELIAQPQRGSSPHGMARVCNNDALHAARSATGDFPIGAAAVKELYNDDGTLTGHSVSRRITADHGRAAWYWYEKASANGTDPHNCTSCHSSSAARDFVFTLVP